MKISKFIRLISVLLSALIISSVLTIAPVYAEETISGDVGTCSWSLDDTTGILRIMPNGGGKLPDFQHYTAKYWTDENGVRHESDLPWLMYKSKIKQVIIGQGVTYIGQGSFSGLKNEIEVYLPTGVSLGPSSFNNAVISYIRFTSVGNIGEKAFYNATLPEELSINAEYIGKNAFAYTKITKLTFGSKLTKIDEYAFYGCSMLRTVGFNSALRTIGAYAFAGFTSPYNICGLYVDSFIENIGEHAFGYLTSGKRNSKFTMFTEKDSAADKYAMENEISVEYGKQFFTNYYNADWTLDKKSGILNFNSDPYLQYDDLGWDSKIVTPDASDEYWSSFVDQYGSYVKTLQIGERSTNYNVIDEISTGFSMLKYLNTVELLDKNTTVIQDKAFKGVKSLKTVTLSEKIETIGEEAFADCTSLQTVNFNNNLKEIKDSAFSGCGLQFLKIGDNSEKEESLGELTVGKNVFSNCLSLASVSLGERVTCVPESCFEGCIKLSKVDYSNKLTAIGSSAFKNCRVLSNFMIGKGLTSIGSQAFLNTELSGIFIPSEITKIGSEALCYYNDGSSSYVNSNAILYVGEDSAALSYAKNNGIKYEVNAGGSMGNTSWRFNPETSELIISGKGEMEEFTTSNTAPWMEFSYKIKSVKIGEGITTISRKAFADDFLNLESVSIGETVNSIGMQAFYNCPLKTVTIPESVTEIRKQAFGYLESVYGDISKNTELVIYLKKGSIAETYAVENELTYEYITSGGNTGDCTWSLDPNKGTLTISGSGKMGSSEKSFDTPWYSQREEVKSVIIEEGVTNVGKKAFMEFPNLEKVFLPESLREIEEGAFANDDSLKEMYVPSSCETIADRSIGFSYLYPNVDEITGLLDHDFRILSLEYLSEAITYARNRFNMKYNFIREGRVGDCIWRYNSANELSILGKGPLEYDNCPWDEYRDEITKVNVDYGITTIPDQAFANCPNLKTVKIYDTITSIGKGAFEGDSALDGFSVPAYVTEVQDRTFKNCTAIDYSYILHSNIKKIGSSAFENCTAMSYYTLPESVEEIGDRAFANTGTSYVTFSENLVSIGEYAYFNTGITSIDIPETVENIGDHAFGFKGTEEAPQSVENFTVTALRDSAGHKYAIKHKLSWINTIDGDIGEIHWAFDSATSVLTLSGTGNIPDNSNSYWSRHSGNIREIVIEDGITGIGADAFARLTNSFEKTVKVSIPQSVEFIGNNAFTDTYINDISIPSGVKTIGDAAFSDTGLKNIKINAGVSEIGAYVFVNTCEKSIEIPDTVTKIGQYAIGYDNWYGSPTSFEIRWYDEYVVTGSKGSEAERYVNDNEGLVFKEYIPETEPTEPTETEPTVTESTATKPTATEPTVTEPTATEPTVTEPTVTEPTATEPTATEPTVTEPTVTEPTVTEPTVTEPTSTEPTATETTITEPTIPEQTTTKPTATEPYGTYISNWKVVGLKNKTYSGKVIKQNFDVVSDDGEYAEYSVVYKNNKYVGTAKVIITGKGEYFGTIIKTFKITKAKNPMTVKPVAKTVSFKTLKKKNIAVKKAITVKKNQGNVSYSRVKKRSSKYLTVSAKGIITVKKKIKKGTYKIVVKVTAKGNKNYKPISKTVTVKITVK